MGYSGNRPHPIQSLYPRRIVARGYTSIYFGENELSPGLIRLSLLPTSHPLSFQPKWVRSSTQFNPRFNLLMGRSPGFASTTYDNVALLRLGFPMASPLRGLTGPQTVTRRIILLKARRHTLNRAPTACRHMVSGSVSSPSRGSSHLSLALLSSLSVIREYLALRNGLRRFSRSFTCSDLLRCSSGDSKLSSTGLSPSVACRIQDTSSSQNFLTPM